MTPRPLLVTAAAVAAAALMAATDEATSTERYASVVAASAAEDPDALRRWDARIDALTRTGELRAARPRLDSGADHHRHEYLVQTADGIPVHGAGVTRRTDAAGVTLSLLGTIHHRIDAETTPAVEAAAIVARLEARAATGVRPAGTPAATILPLPDRSYRLAWRVPMTDARYHFIDAGTGALLHALEARRDHDGGRAAVGAGEGLRGTRKKVNASRAGDRFHAWDRTRPAEIVTLDLQSDADRAWRLLVEHPASGLPRGHEYWALHDVAADADNLWEDAGVVDVHAHTGWTYNYLAARHGWHGIDGVNGRIVSMTNTSVAPADFNAFFIPPPFGPEGTGSFVYGRADDDEPLSSLDIVGHELMHGVTHAAMSRRSGNELGVLSDPLTSFRLGPERFTDRYGATHVCGRAYFTGGIPGEQGVVEGPLPALCIDGRFVLGSDQGGAVNEALSDIVGEAVGFFHTAAGASADYLIGSDQSSGAIRSLSNPVADTGLPDHYDHRIEFALAGSAGGPWSYSEHAFVGGRYAASTGACCYGAEHLNSTILSHAFYLTVEGGQHLTSGLRVDGAGGRNREQIERIFFRAMTAHLPQAASLPLAAEAVRQAAAELHAANVVDREAVQATTSALRAVGLPGLDGF